jgi:hypothetical protein
MARLSRHPGDSLPGLRKRDPGYAAVVFWIAGSLASRQNRLPIAP